MPRLLAIDWDHQNVRLVLADSDRRQNLRVIAVSQTAVAAGEESIEQRIGSALGEAVRAAGGEKARCLIGIGHGQIDLAHVEVPPSTDDEIPDLVVNLAQRELTTATDGTAIDFVAYKSTGTMRPVCIMVLPDEERAHIQAVCQFAGIQPTRIVPRTFGLKAFGTESDPTLVVSCTDSSADLALFDRGQPLVARSLRFPTNSTLPRIAGYLTNELRRTLLSHPHEDELPETISQVCVLSNEPLAKALVGPLAEEFETSPVVVNPFVGLQTSLPATPDAGYSSLLGMLLVESSGERPDVDFLHPKQPPRPTSRTTPFIAAALCFVLLVVGGVWYTQTQFANIDAENERLTKELAELKSLVKKSSPKRQLAKMLSAWEQSRINWPDELRDITLRMPPRSAMTIQNLTVSAGRNGSSVISFRGAATNPDAVAIMESRLRDKYHNPRTPGLREQRSGDKTMWTFQTSMSVKARTKAEYTSHLDADLAAKAGDPSTSDEARTSE
jgi:hypothetical protein